jgi:hypothetical protein
MPRRKKSTATKPKGSKSGISINIKNIMRQVQNERPAKQDFINLSGKRPMDNLESGSMSRLQIPAMTYASRPLSQFPSLASISNIDRGFAPPLSQLTSNSTQPLGSSPLVSPSQDKQNDVLERFRPSVKAVASNPVIPPVAVRGYNPAVAEITAPVERYLVPAGLPSNLLEAYDGKEDEFMDEAQRLVAGQVPAGYLGARERVSAMAASMGRGRPKLGPGEEGKKKERLQYGPPIPRQFQQGRTNPASPGRL